MIQYILDTNHASSLWLGHQPLIDRILAAGRKHFGLCAPSVAEMWYMVFNSSRALENERRLRPFLSDFQTIPLSFSAREDFGRIKAELRRIGRPIPDMDILIAAIARVNGMTILTADSHFSHVPGLATENWLA